MNTMYRRLSAALLTITLVLVGSPALAHVTVSSPDARAGGWGKIVFRVPTESPTASTTAVTIHLPSDKPLAFVSVQPKPGWTTSVVKTKLAKPVSDDGMTITEAVSSITWTATGPGIAPGQFDEFALSGGPLPETGSLQFTATQTYSDGTTAAWDQVQKGDDEPEHPAPTLSLSAEQADHDDHDESADGPDGPDNVARGLGAAALAVAVIGVFGAFRRRKADA